MDAATVGEWLGIFEPWWPAIAQIVTFWFVGQVMKKNVWTKARAVDSMFFDLMRSTMGLHPMIAGACWGACYPFMPAVASVGTRGGAITQGILCGVLSVLAFKALEYYAEARGKTGLLRFLRETGDRPTVRP